MCVYDILCVYVFFFCFMRVSILVLSLVLRSDYEGASSFIYFCPWVVAAVVDVAIDAVVSVEPDCASSPSVRAGVRRLPLRVVTPTPSHARLL